MSERRTSRDLHRAAAQYDAIVEPVGRLLELRIQESTAADVLERLASDNFLDVKISNEILYRFNPATSTLEQAAARCAEFYLRERIAMINVVMAATLGPMHDFAEAFRIKKGRSDG